MVQYIPGRYAFPSMLIGGTLLFAPGSITDSSGALDFGDENLTTTGCFSAGAATLTSVNFGDESLNAYKSRTWIPAWSSATGAVASYSTQSGRLTRVGRLVFFSGRLTIDDIGTASGNMTITGLQENGAATDMSGMTVHWGGSLNITAGYTIAGYIQAGTKTILCTLADVATGTSTLQASEVSAGGDIMFHGFYEI